MNITENIRIALRALTANKLRAALTMLGIMIGVAAVITLLAIGDGVTRYIADQFVGLGTNLVFVTANVNEDSPNARLTLQDAEQLGDPTIVPNVAVLAPSVFRSVEVQYRGQVYRTTAEASTSSYGVVRNYVVARGRFLEHVDVNGRSRVVVLGQDVIDNLFPEDVDPLDTEIKINGITFRVIGILEAKGGGLFGSQDDLIIVPLTTAGDRLFNLRGADGALLVGVIWIQAVDSEAVEDILIDTAIALRQSHNINFRDADDFSLFTQQDFLSAFGEVTGVLTLFLGAIASISLLVGGIGIMNIMLVSVTERTREIGLRKAVGAKKRDILGQFLAEAMVLALIGGLFGIVLGYGGATAVHLAVPELDTTITLNAVALAVGFSVAVGLFFGIYPATRAAALHPIDALRFE
jgi:putative ABC transport system permease protein